jgi:predicted DNA-binding transcriptional regulator YafY
MGESARLDDAAKQRIKAALEAQATAHVKASDLTVGEERSAAMLDQTSSYSVDDLSQSDEEGELSGLLAAAGAQQQANLERIRALDLGLKKVVEPGAVVAFGGDHYVVGVVADEFECDGVTYEGISADSPAYAAIAGLREGDTFTFGDRDHRLDLVT